MIALRKAIALGIVTVMLGILAVGGAHAADKPAVVPQVKFSWKALPEGLRFDFSFAEKVEVRQYDETLQAGYYYIDFHGSLGPAEQADWTFNTADLEHVRRVYYPQQKVLRYIFYAKSGTHPRFSLRGAGRIYALTLTPFRLMPLGAAKATPSARKKIVIIDPGHGGKSLGAQTSQRINGRHYEEKELVLQIAKRMIPLFQNSPNLEFRMTRTSDTFVSLEDRIAFAEKAEGDLFLSIHLNASSSRRKDARGFEIYYLSDGTKETNRQLEDLENDRAIDVNGHLSGGGDLKMILADLANSKLGERRAESFQACQTIDSYFRLAGPFRNHSRGVKAAAFRVLMNYQMPAVLAECGFIDNAEDAALLVQPKYQEQIAALLFNAINLYFSKIDPEFQGYQAPVS
jgi:N-acetylmuramoyl-L-alanine amidase